jgi:hypothetical protein
MVTKKSPSIDPLETAFVELQRIEARYSMLDELIVTLDANTVQRTYAKAEFEDLAWRRDAVQLYAATLQANSADGCLAQVRLLKVLFGISQDIGEEPKSPRERELEAACQRLIYSIDSFLSSAADCPLYSSNYRDPFKSFEQQLREIGHSMDKSGSANKAPARG